MYRGCIKPTKSHGTRYITLCNSSLLGMYQVYSLLWHMPCIALPDVGKIVCLVAHIANVS